MSKAFTKEGDGAADDVPAVNEWVPAPGEKNYLTPAGAAWLQSEIERVRGAQSTDPRMKIANEQRLAALLQRFEAAEVTDPAGQPRDRALFGATVTVRGEDDTERAYRIVGIDEADGKRGWVSWKSPVARALLNRSVGDVTTIRTPGGDEEVEIVGIDYEVD